MKYYLRKVTEAGKTTISMEYGNITRTMSTAPRRVVGDQIIEMEEFNTFESLHERYKSQVRLLNNVEEV